MRIMDLNFQTAMKYAYLGDDVYRLAQGRQNRCQILDRDGEVYPVDLSRHEYPFYWADLVSNDWVAESTDRSV